MLQTSPRRLSPQRDRTAQPATIDEPFLHHDRGHNPSNPTTTGPILPQPSQSTLYSSYPFTLTLGDGRRAAGFCGMARGMPERPLSDEELLEKFRASGAYAGLSLPRVEIEDFDPVAVFEHAMGESD